MVCEALTGSFFKKWNLLGNCHILSGGREEMHAQAEGRLACLILHRMRGMLFSTPRGCLRNTDTFPPLPRASSVQFQGCPPPPHTPGSWEDWRRLPYRSLICQHGFVATGRGHHIPSTTRPAGTRARCSPLTRQHAQRGTGRRVRELQTPLAPTQNL